MMIRFQTKFGQLLMQGEPALALIRLGGHSGSVPGAILAAELPAFQQRLRAGLELHGEAYSPAPVPREPGDEENDEPRERPVRLRQRAVPLLDMIDTALRQPSDLMWEKA
jgi:hypothetical protein